MTTANFYSVISYLPDPVLGERINIGVVAFGEAIVSSRFIQDWSRVRRFGNEDIRFLQDFARRMEEATSAEQPLPLAGVGAVGPDTVRRMAETWIESIQLTPPRASLLTVEELLDDAAERFLRERPVRRPTYRDRRIAAGIAVRQLRNALEFRGQAVRDYLKKSYIVSGRFDAHKFDAVLANGTVYSAAHGISFEKPDNVELEEEIKAVAFAAEDILGQHPTLPVAIVALKPRQPSKLFDRAQRIFEGIGAAVVDEDAAGAWAMEVTGLLPLTGAREPTD